MKLNLLLFFLTFLLFSALAEVVHNTPQVGEVKTYIKTVELPVGTNSILQKRWYVENEHVRLGVIDDPGGAVVEFVNKANGVNHVAGDVYKIDQDGDVKRIAGWGWIEFIHDSANDPTEQWMYAQPFDVEFVEVEKGARGIKVTGQTVEQKIERWMTLTPDSPELTVKIKLTNISDHPRPLWLRWHPQVFPSKDIKGKQSCVLSPGVGDEVRKIRTAWGWDHWFWTHDGYWLAADFKTGDGLFCAFEKEKVPIHFTWTQYKHDRPTSGAVTMEPFPRLITANAGEAIDATFTYYPFSQATDSATMPLSLLKDPDEQTRARSFLARVMPLEHLEKFGAYTYARTLQFPWGHRRRDLLGVREWGFADCAIMGYPTQDKPLRIRMTAAAFDEASALQGWPKWQPGVTYHITMTDQDGQRVYDQRELLELHAGVPGNGGNSADREIAVPVVGIPDGAYTLAVEALDPMTKKTFHKHERQLEIFGNRLKVASEELAKQLEQSEKDPPFVTALATQQAKTLPDGTLEIPIGVEGGSVVRKDAPVSLGVPFPEGLSSTNFTATLLDSTGHVINANFEVMNVWQDHSLKWLRTDFQADCPAGAHVFYTMSVRDKATDETRKKETKENDDLITVEAEAIIVTTGGMRVVIPRNTLSIPGLVYLDRNGDGVFTDDECVIRASDKGDIWWTDGHGVRYVMTLDGPRSQYFTPGVTLEENTPLAATVKLQGWYRNPDHPDSTPAYGEIRIRFFRNKAWFKVWHQVTFTASPWDVELKSYGLTLNLDPTRFQTINFDVDGQVVDGSASAELFQSSANRVKISHDAQQVAEGHRSDGAVQFRGKDSGFLFYHRNFWQMAPKKLTADATSGRLTIHYWPEEAGIQTFKPIEEMMIPSSASPEACGTGFSRTQEMTFDLSNEVVANEARATYGDPVLALPPPSWTQKTRVVGNLQPYNPTTGSEVEDYLKLYIDFLLRNRDFFGFYGQWDYGTLHNVYNLDDYTWRIVGRYANIGNEEDIVDAPWLLYMRSGDRRYFELAESWTRHLMEVQSIRWSNLFPKTVGMSRRHHYTPWLSEGDYGHTMLCPYLEYYHVTGYRPAWEMAKMTADGMADIRSGSWRYISNPLIGSIRMYTETADKKYKQLADRIWNELCTLDGSDWWGGTHGARMARWYAPFNAECEKAWLTGSTGTVISAEVYTQPFREIDSAAELNERTGISWYAHTARWNFDNERSQYTGLIHGTHPIYRGMVPYSMNTQAYMGLARMLTTGKGAIERSHELFPAKLVNLNDVKEAVVTEQTDTAFTIWVSGAPEQEFPVIGPTGAVVQTETKVLFSSKYDKRQIAFYEISVPLDGLTGAYRLKPSRPRYFGSSLPEVTLITGNTLSGAGDALYVRSDDLGAPAAQCYLTGTPGASFELFDLSGKRIFSETFVRPASDAVAIAFDIALPPGQVLRIGDHSGVHFPELKQIPLLLNPPTSASSSRLE